MFRFMEGNYKFHRKVWSISISFYHKYPISSSVNIIYTVLFIRFSRHLCCKKNKNKNKKNPKKRPAFRNTDF